MSVALAEAIAPTSNSQTWLDTMKGFGEGSKTYIALAIETLETYQAFARAGDKICTPAANALFQTVAASVSVAQTAAQTQITPQASASKTLLKVPSAFGNRSFADTLTQLITILSPRVRDEVGDTPKYAEALNGYTTKLADLRP